MQLIIGEDDCQRLFLQRLVVLLFIIGIVLIFRSVQYPEMYSLNFFSSFSSSERIRLWLTSWPKLSNAFSYSAISLYCPIPARYFFISKPSLYFFPVFISPAAIAPEVT